MRRTILIVGVAAVLCFAALTVWAYARRTEPEGRRIGEGELQQTQRGPESAYSAEKQKTDPHVFELSVAFVYLGDGKNRFGYVDESILYLWKDFALREDQLSEGDRSPMGGRMRVQAKEFKAIKPIDGLIKYRETIAGYRPGFFDHSCRLFYQWKGVVLKKTELLDKSQDGKDPLLDSWPALDPRRASKVIEIDIPAHLKANPELWKKGGAYNPEAYVRAQKKMAAEQKAAQKRAQDPRTFQMPVWCVVFRDDEYQPCYCDLRNTCLYAWKGVALRPEQVPAEYKGWPYKAPSNDYIIAFTDPPVSYREVSGKYRPGYLNRPIGAFYEWKGIVLSKQEVPEKSQDGQPAVVSPDKLSQVIEIDMPAHLKKQPQLWKKP
jgi:hypothetical protein